jgi:NTP pyrophosphatase (non-canonical NTP hydrolase)
MRYGTLKDCVHIQRVEIEPSTREKPFRFQNIADALAFSRITGQIVYCVIGPDVDFFIIFPGGRVEDHSSAVLETNERHEAMLMSRRARIAAPTESDGVPKASFKCSNCGAEDAEYIHVRGLGCSKCNPIQHFNSTTPTDSGNAAQMKPLTFAEFSRVNRERCESPQGFNHKLESWSTSDWFLAMIGEVGEAANIAKKLNRYRDGIPGNKVSREELEAKLRQELGDVFVYLDLLAQSVGVSIADAAVEVFNAKSQELGCPIQLRVALRGAESTPAEGTWLNLKREAVAPNPNQFSSGNVLTPEHLEKAVEVAKKFYTQAPPNPQPAAQCGEDWSEK